MNQLDFAALMFAMLCTQALAAVCIMALEQRGID